MMWIAGWFTERIVTVFSIVLVSLTTVPTSLILISHHDSDESVRVQLIQQVRMEGEAAVVLLLGAEQNCDVQLTQLTAVKTSKPPALVAQLIANGKEREHAAALKFVEKIRAEQARAWTIKDLDDDDAQIIIERIHLIGNTAIGPNGVILITCQTVILEIHTLIVEVVVATPTHRELDDED
jgi:hypothetical protein